MTIGIHWCTTWVINRSASMPSVYQGVQRAEPHAYSCLGRRHGKVFQQAPAVKGILSTMPANDVFYDVAMRRLEEQSSRADGLDTKATAVFTVASGILALFGAILAATSWPSGPGLYVFLILLTTATVMYVITLILSYKALQVRKFSLRPDLPSLRRLSATMSSEEMKRAVAEQCLLSIRENDSQLDMKANHLTSALLYLPAEALLLALAVLVLIASK